MKTEGIESIPNGGLKVSTASFARLKAFQGGGDYWDHQELIRDSLGEFLPPVQQVREEGKSFGVFRKIITGRENLWKSRSATEAGIPEEQIRLLKDSLENFKRKADAADTQQNAREIIHQFRLPDISKDPELYRICGPWWNRKLQVLWGCERIPDSSLVPSAAVAKLPIDKTYGLKKALSVIALLLLLCAMLAALVRGLPALKLWAAKQSNKPPIAAVKLDSLDEPNRTATISDAGSKDLDGELRDWLVSWGDGKEEHFGQAPQKVQHAYDTERDYTIRLWCVDKYGVTSSPPASVEARFDYQMRQNALAEAQKAAGEITQKAQEEAAKANKEREEAQRETAAAEQKLKDLQNAAARIQTNPPAVADIPPVTNTNPQVGEQASTPARKAAKSASDLNTNITNADQRAAPLIGDASTNAPVVDEGSSPDTPIAGLPPQEMPKGAEMLMYRDLEIVKAGVGSITAENTLDAMLVVRDKKHPNTPLDVIEWTVDGKSYRTGNAQFTTRLLVKEHRISVRVKRAGIEQTAKARVIVTGGQTQTTEPDFTVTPLR